MNQMQILVLAVSGVFFLACQKKPSQETKPEGAVEAHSHSADTSKPDNPYASSGESETDRAVDELLTPADQNLQRESSVDQRYQANSLAQAQARKSDEASQKKPSRSPLDKSQGAARYWQGLAALKKGSASRAKEYFLSACQLGSLLGCHSYAWRLQGEGQLLGAERFYKLGCYRGLAKSCNNLGFLHERWENYAEARAFYRRACNQNHSNGCHNLVRVPKSPAKAPQAKVKTYAEIAPNLTTPQPLVIPKKLESTAPLKK